MAKSYKDNLIQLLKFNTRNLNIYPHKSVHVKTEIPQILTTIN